MCLPVCTCFRVFEMMIAGADGVQTEAQEVTDVSGESAHSAFPREGDER